MIHPDWAAVLLLVFVMITFGVSPEATLATLVLTGMTARQLEADTGIDFFDNITALILVGTVISVLSVIAFVLIKLSA